jgi:DNA topoisomerase VI subunit B
MTTATLKRETFTFSRELEFLQERELTAQVGIDRYRWPLVMLKELVDNALDACETAGVAPALDVTIGEDVISVSDNGPGIPADVVTRILDFSTRTSDKEAYRSPTRGQQGNALKTILGMSYNLARGHGRVVIDSQGTRHDVRISLDGIAQRPAVEHDQEESVKTEGTAITVYTGIKLWDYMPEFLQILHNYTVFSPHLTLRLDLGDGVNSVDRASNPTWQKWIPSDTTSPHWYATDEMSRLIGAHIAKARDDGGEDLTLNKFVSQFRGLSSTQRRKSITDTLPGTRRLSDFVNGSRLDTSRIAELLRLMKAESKPVPPDALGIIGEDHFKTVLGTETMQYHCYRHKGDVPFVVEAVFCYDKEIESPDFVLGLNFTPTLGDAFASTAVSGTYHKKEKQGYGVKGLAYAFRVDNECPGCHLVVHVVHPALNFRDRGKSQIIASAELGEAVGETIASVLKEHYALRDKANKGEEAEERDRQRREKAARSTIPSLKEAVYAVIKEAADKASGGGKYLYSVRQLYYAVRPMIQEYTNKALNYAYFTPTLVTDYEDAHSSLEKLVYDPRGHLLTPHSGKSIPLGTKDVENYEIPEWEYDKILYVEKEGFNEIFNQAELGRRYDMAIMTAKGYAPRAAKQMLSKARGREISILVAHDADLFGYEIRRTIADATRTSKLSINIIDIGLTVGEALAMGLPRERVENKKKREAPGALKAQVTPEELAFLKQYRIELNAMTSDQLIAWIERKLREHGLDKKVVPPDDVLSGAIKANVDVNFSEWTETAIRLAIERVMGTTLRGLADELTERLEHPETTGHRDELLSYVADLPADNWQTWSVRRAEELGVDVTKNLSQMAEDRIKELIEAKR